MNEKITRQIEEMKQQTIGVEVEMNSITRAKAARLAATFSEQADTKTQPDATATAPGRLGIQTAESGNSKRMSASQDATAKSANWSLRF